MNNVLRQKKRLALRHKRMITGLLFISPWLLGVTCFFVFNLIKAIWYSFCTLKIGVGETNFQIDFIGVANYKELFTVNPYFNRMLVDSIGGLVVDVPLIVFFSLFMAILLNQKFRGRTLARIIFFLPVILDSGAISSALSAGFAMLSSGLNNVPGLEQVSSVVSTEVMLDLMRNIGFPYQIADYILNAILHIYDIMTVSGVQMLIFLAALQSVPSSLYEVASIEGATSYESFWKITFPLVSPLILTNVVYTIVNSYSKSNLVNLAYTTAFSGTFNMGLSSAISVVSSITVCFILALISWSITKYIFYQNS